MNLDQMLALPNSVICVFENKTSVVVIIIVFFVVIRKVDVLTAVGFT